MSGWKVKIEGKEGWHKVKKIIPPESTTSTDQKNMYVLDNGDSVHADLIEDLDIADEDDDLEKHTVVDDTAVSNRLGNKFGQEQEDRDYSHLRTDKIQHQDKKMFHHIFSGMGDDGEKFWRHTVSPHSDPNKTPAAEMHIVYDPYEYEGKYVDFVAKNPKLKDNPQYRGVGKKLYESAVQHHQELHSDTLVTKNAQKIWNYFSGHEDYDVQMGNDGDMKTRHKVTYKPKTKNLDKSERITPVSKSAINKLKDFQHNLRLKKSIPEGKVYIAMDGDNAGSQVERAALKNDVDAIQDVSNKIKKGSLAVKDYAETVFENVEMVVFGGDDIGFMVDKIDDIEKKINFLRNIYKNESGFSITAGVGKTIPNATQALLYGKTNGKDQTVVYNKDVQQFVRRMTNNDQTETPEEKVQGIMNDGYDQTQKQ